MVRISIASGKGGTGKTLVAINLAAVARDAVLVDLDVEEPNCHLFFSCEEESRKVAHRKVPVIDKEKCTQCGNCAKVCEFHAIASLPKEVLVFDELCHGCGACAMFCPEGAIEERDYAIGEIIHARVSGLQGLIYGKLRIGEASAANLIRQVKREIPQDGFTIIDSPPGTACPAVESIRGSDLCVLVTEPTAFGFHDLKLAVATAEKLRLRHVVLINKQGLPGPDVTGYCKERGIPVVGEIPHSKEIARAYSIGSLLVTDRVHAESFGAVLKRLREEVGGF
ncbi:MAG: ATP-binding protein [Thermoplasmata archaeon]